MAGNRFTKKLQAIKSRMMMDDVPVDPSRRKLFTLPPEETSQSLPATKQTSKESPLTQLANKPVDRREFLKQAGQSAKSAAVRVILPELGKLVEAPIEKVLSKEIPAKDPHEGMWDAIRDELYEQAHEHHSAEDILRRWIETGQYPVSKAIQDAIDKTSKRMDEVSKSEDLDYRDIEEGLYYLQKDMEEHLGDHFYDIDSDHIFNMMEEFGLDTDQGSIAELLHYKGFKPEQIHDFLDTNYPYYDEDVVNEALQNVAKDE